MDERKLKMESMNKKGFIRRLAQNGYTIKDATVIVDDFINTIEDILVEGGSITFHGFGTFSSITRKERLSTSVRTGETISIPSFRSPKFEAGKALKRSVRDGIVRR